MREELFSDVDFGKYMKWWRFKQIKHYIPLVMEDTKMKEEDVDWWKFKNRILQHNASKIKNISASHVLVFDESMSSFIPRTTKTGGLPNLLYVCRKPELLGTEFKNIVDGMIVTMIWLEIQEVEHRMRALEYTHDLGGTAACVMRGVTKVSHFAHHRQHEIESVDTPYLLFGDSWFGSVKAVSNVKVAGHRSCFLVETGHSRSPKAFLEDKMKDFPGGTWITLEAKTEHEGVDLIYIG